MTELAIRRLTLRKTTTVAVLSRLPAQMLSLGIRFDIDPMTYDDEEEEDDDEGEGEAEEKGLGASAAVISKMGNLKELRIAGVGEGSLNWQKDQDRALSSMFDKLHQLEKVSIISYYAHHVHSGLNGDSVMFSLVQHNPNLRDVRFHGIYFTAAAFASLAQLQHLTHITLGMAYGVGEEFRLTQFSRC